MRIPPPSRLPPRSCSRRSYAVSEKLYQQQALDRVLGDPNMGGQQQSGGQAGGEYYDADYKVVDGR